jgi:hypothetical protein
VDQRTGGRRRPLPAAPATGGSDAALGQPTRRGGGPGRAAHLHLHAWALHRSSADRDPPARGGRGRG